MKNLIKECDDALKALSKHTPGGQGHDQSNHGRRLGSEGGGVGVAENWHQIDTAAAMSIHDEFTGSTHDIQGNNLAFQKSLFSVGGVVSVEMDGNLTDDLLQKFIDDNREVLETADGRIAVGTWWDSEAKKTWLDITTILDNRESAVQLGTDRNQISIFDLENMEEIKIGGTGKLDGKSKSENTRTPEEIREAMRRRGQWIRDNHSKTDS